VAAQQIAQQLGEEMSAPFTAALLHDLGKLILTTAVGDRYQAVIEATKTKGLCFLDAEKKVLGVQHAEIGGRLLARWKFPKRIVLAVWFHHDPAKAQPFNRLASLIHVADGVSHFLDDGYGHQPFTLHGRPEALKALGLTEADLEPCLAKTLEGLEAVACLAPKGV
jgi:putative nucleotidyltransferase with HDIG domain